MRIEKIFCDICGREGANTHRKDAKILISNDEKMNQKEIFLDSEKTIPYITLSFAKKNTGRGIFELDICNGCESLIKEATTEALFRVYVPFKERNKKKGSK